MNQCATLVRTRCPVRPNVALDGPSISSTTYARMFPELPSFEADEQFLHALGRTGGACDRGDIDDSPESLGDTAAGWPIFGQFIAHDITADRSVLQSGTNSVELHNARSPQLNLECLYGDGPSGHPFLYQRDDPAKFLLGSDEIDVQRNAEGIAVIGDPRNDTHLVISQRLCLKSQAAPLDRVSTVTRYRRVGVAHLILLPALMPRRPDATALRY